MDRRRFDDVARAFAQRTDRRRLGAVAMALVAAALAPDAGRAVAAPRLVCRQARASCTRNAQCCSGYCETRRGAPRPDRNRCGCPRELVCGDRCCAVGQTCAAGSCRKVCEVEAPAFFCVGNPDGEVVQTCGGESMGGVSCTADSDCAHAAAWCSDPGFHCMCVTYRANEVGDVLPYGPVPGSGMCSIEQLPHESLGCDWGKCSRTGGPCEIPPDCCSYLFAPYDTACNGGQCMLIP
jgi:hypothetical protein